MSWQPLAGSDPLPGDPAAVDAYAASLTRTADVIAQQVGMLRRLADPGNWVADTADAFREQARDLAKDIDKAEGRYRAVGSELSRWSTVLADAQRAARRIRDEAQQLQAVVSSNPVPVPQPDPDTLVVELTPAQEAQLNRRRNAEDAIDRLKDDLDRLKDDTDQQAWEYARRIRAALDDDVADSWFDRLKAKLSGISDVLKQIAKWAGYIGMALALVVLVLTVVLTAPAWLLTAAMLATAVGLIANLGLALSENGSWWAVALDVVSVLTFRVGKWAKLGSTGTMNAARAIVGKERSAAAMATFFGQTQKYRTALLQITSSESRLAGRWLKVPARWLLRSHYSAGSRVGESAARTVHTVPETGFWRNVVHNGKSTAGLRAQADDFLRESSNPEVVALAQTTKRLINVQIGAALAADASSLVGSYVKEQGPTTDLGRWRILISRFVKGFR